MCDESRAALTARGVSAIDQGVVLPKIEKQANSIPNRNVISKIMPAMQVENGSAVVARKESAVFCGTNVAMLMKTPMVASVPPISNPATCLKVSLVFIFFSFILLSFSP